MITLLVGLLVGLVVLVATHSVLWALIAGIVGALVAYVVLTGRAGRVP